jgi:gamma-glutamyltranspeptidase/glutathione hydrolase
LYQFAFAVCLLTAAIAVSARQPASREALWQKLEPFARPPAEFAGKVGSYRSPLQFADGSIAKTPADWQRRRAEILATWHKRLGAWPPKVERPAIKKLESVERDGYTEHKVQVQASPDGKWVDGYLLVPKGPGPFPAVVVPFYEPLTSIGRGDKGRGVGTHDYGLQLVKRGFVTLSIGTPGSLDKLGGDTRSALVEAGETLRRQPLTLLAYVASNCLAALAQMPEVDATRIGIIGLSYGGKWSMFASCLDDRFACAVWSDPGIVFNEKDANVNYWEPWYLGFDPKAKRKAGIPSADNPRTGLYKELIDAGEDLVDLHALMAPRPVLVSGGVQDPPRNWQALNHLVAVNTLLGKKDRVFMTARKTHIPTAEALELEVAFLEYFLKHAPQDASPSPKRNTRLRPAVGTQGMISTAHPLATQAGLEILEAGGNAFDAAVAVAATLNVVEPMMSGMGGFGVTLLYDAQKGAVRCLDASGRFPAATDSDVFRAPTAHYLDNRKGAKSVSTPGNANAWETLAKTHGKLPWTRLFAPAIKLADDGFVISANTARHIQSEFAQFPEHARHIYGKDGKPLQAGDRLVQKDLARSLRLVAAQGARAVHGGELGEAIDKVMRETGGFLTLDDLKRNRAEWWDPVSIDYRGHTVVASPVPNNAWNGLLRLGIMSRFDPAKLGHNTSTYLHTYAEATKLAYEARLRYAGDRDNPPPLDRLLSEKYWALEAARIKPDRTQPLKTPTRLSPGEEHTTHFVIADAQGNVVTSTQTLGMLFGSKVMPPGTGIWLNNSMQYCAFEPKGNPLDAIAGRRKLAGFCPMLVMSKGKPWLAVGSPGGHTIVQTVPQIVMNVVDFHMDVQQAIAAPRLSFVEPDITAVDEGIPESVRKELSALGHNVRVTRLGNAHGLAIEYDASGSPHRFTGGSDPRGEGAAIGR